MSRVPALLSLPLWLRLLLATVVVALYATLFVALYPRLGTSVAVFASVPVVLIALFWGVRGGVGAALLSIPLDLALLWMLGTTEGPPGILAFIVQPGHLILLLIGAIVGQLRTLSLRVHQELHSRAEMASALERRDRILEAVGAVADQLLQAPISSESISGVLATLGEATQVSRVYVFENHVAEAGTFLTSQRHEWVAEGILPEIDNPELQALPMREAGFDRWVEELAAGNVVHGPIDSFPASERALLEGQEIRSLVVVPIMTQGQWWGFIGFDDCTRERHWSHAEIEALRTAADALGAVTVRQRMERALHRRVDELAALHDTVMDVISAHDLPTLLQTIVERAARLLRGDGGGLYLVVPERDEVRLVVESNSGSDYRGTVLAYGEGAAGRVAQSGQPLIIRDYRSWEGRARAFEQTRSFTSILSAPMLWQARVIGVIHVLSHVERDFSKEDLELLSLFANQAAIAVENARLLSSEREQRIQAEAAAHELQQRERFLMLLSDITRTALRTTEFVPLLQLLADRLKELFAADDCYIALWDERTQEVVPMAASGSLWQLQQDLASRQSAPSLAAQLLEGGAPIAIENVAASPYIHRRTADLLEKTRSILGLPLIAGTEKLGAALVGFHQWRQFTPEELRQGESAAAQIALAMARARAFEVERTRNAQLESLRQVSLSLTASLNMEEVFASFLAHTLSLFAADNAHIFLYDGERLTFGAARWADGRPVSPFREPRPDGLTATVARDGRRIVIPDVNAHPLFREWSWGGGIAGLPLCIGGTVRGVMNVAFDMPHDFDEDTLRLLELLADQAAIALENARLFEAEQRRRGIASALLEIAQVASSSLELKQILKHITQRTAAICDATRCAVFLLDEDQRTVRSVMTQFADGHMDEALWQRFRDFMPFSLEAFPLFHMTIMERRPRVLSGASLHDMVPLDWIEALGIHSILVVPLFAHDTPLGIMVLDHATPHRVFSGEHIHLAQTIGGQITAHIENARLYAHMQQLAITDPLTELYNRRGFFQLGEREVEQAIRFHRSLSVILFDIDHFKRVNDSHGHPVGDEVLVALAGRLAGELRSVDLLARYGGEEFVILLPEADLVQGAAIAERLRHAVASAPFPTSVGEISITISLGVTPVSPEAQSLTALVELADRALYGAKRGGRNAVCSAPPHRGFPT